MAKFTKIYNTKITRGNVFSIRIRKDGKLVEVARLLRFATTADCKNYSTERERREEKKKPSNKKAYKGFYTLEDELANVIANWTNPYTVSWRDAKIKDLEQEEKQEIIQFVENELTKININLPNRYKEATRVLKLMLTNGVDSLLNNVDSTISHSEIFEKRIAENIKNAKKKWLNC